MFNASCAVCSLRLKELKANLSGLVQWNLSNVTDFKSAVNVSNVYFWNQAFCNVFIFEENARNIAAQISILETKNISRIKNFKNKLRENTRQLIFGMTGFFPESTLQRRTRIFFADPHTSNLYRATSASIGDRVTGRNLVRSTRLRETGRNCVLTNAHAHCVVPFPPAFVEWGKGAVSRGRREFNWNRQQGN